MNTKVRKLLPLALISFSSVLLGSSAAAQTVTPGVLLKVAVPTVLAGQTLQPGSYVVRSWADTGDRVLTIQKAGATTTTKFLLANSVSEGNGTSTEPAVASYKGASGLLTITSIYFPEQDRAYHFSYKIEAQHELSPSARAAASNTAQ
jgi:hypothetical protein